MTTQAISFRPLRPCCDARYGLGVPLYGYKEDSHLPRAARAPGCVSRPHPLRRTSHHIALLIKTSVASDDSPVPAVTRRTAPGITRPAGPSPPRYRGCSAYLGTGRRCGRGIPSRRRDRRSARHPPPAAPLPARRPRPSRVPRRPLPAPGTYRAARGGRRTRGPGSDERPAPARRPCTGTWRRERGCGRCSGHRNGHRNGLRSARLCRTEGGTPLSPAPAACRRTWASPELARLRSHRPQRGDRTGWEGKKQGLL